MGGEAARDAHRVPGATGVSSLKFRLWSERCRGPLRQTCESVRAGAARCRRPLGAVGI